MYIVKTLRGYLETIHGTIYGLISIKSEVAWQKQLKLLITGIFHILIIPYAVQFMIITFKIDSFFKILLIKFSLCNCDWRFCRPSSFFKESGDIPQS